MENELEIVSKEDLFLYLDDIKEYVNSILLYHKGYYNLDLKEIIMYLSTVDEIIENIKLFLLKNNDER